MSDKTDQERRHFLFSVSGAAVAAAGGSLVVQGCGTSVMPMDGGGMETGGPTFVGTGLTVGDVAMGSAVSSRTASTLAIVGRDAMGFYALSSICTHQQCTVAAVMPGRLDCPCHMSHYDLNGNVVMPAPGSTNQQPLTPLPIQFTGTGAAATISVDTRGSVDRSMRYTAP